MAIPPSVTIQSINGAAPSTNPYSHNNALTVTVASAVTASNQLTATIVTSAKVYPPDTIAKLDNNSWTLTWNAGDIGEQGWSTLSVALTATPTVSHTMIIAIN
jgi:hypothetical protein